LKLIYIKTLHGMIIAVVFHENIKIFNEVSYESFRNTIKGIIHANKHTIIIVTDRSAFDHSIHTSPVKKGHTHLFQA